LVKIEICPADFGVNRRKCGGVGTEMRDGAGPGRWGGVARGRRRGK
jgi:hypothetical protein